MNWVIIAIGSNIDAEKNINKMMELLKTEVRILQLSSMQKTKPVGLIDQPYFTNGAVKIETNLSFNELRTYLKELEDQLGRDRSQEKFGPRVIDLDILVFNGELMDEDYLTRVFLRDSAKELGYLHNRK